MFSSQSSPNLKQVHIHYKPSNREQVKSFVINVHTENLKYEDFLHSVISTSSPFFKVPLTDVSIRVTSYEEVSPSQKKLLPEDNIESIIKTRKLWVVTKQNLPVYYTDKDGNNNCKFEEKLWPEDFNVKNLCALLALDMKCNANSFVINAIDPEDNSTLKLTNNTNLEELMLRGFRFRMEMLKVNEELRSSPGLSEPESPDRIIYISFLVENREQQMKVKVPFDTKYADLVRRVTAITPIIGVYKKDLAIVVTSRNATTPEERYLSKEDLEVLDNKKLWVVQKYTFPVFYKDENKQQLKLDLYFWPETLGLGRLTSAVANHFCCTTDSFSIQARNPHDQFVTLITSQLNFEDLLSKGFTFHVKFRRIFSVSTDLEDGSDIEGPNNASYNSAVGKWSCTHRRQRFDYFLSYRRVFDKDIAAVLFYALNGASLINGPIHTFWDDACLNPGERWDNGILYALQQTKVVVLICSEESLDRILMADVEPDNMFLEFEKAHLMYKEQKVQLFLILVGRNREVIDGVEKVTVNVPFNKFGITFPDKKHCHERSPGVYTIQTVMRDIFALQGEHVQGTSIEPAKTKLLNIFSKASESSKSSKFVEPSNSLQLFHEQQETLNKLLKPSHNAMEKERTRLLKSHVEGTRTAILKELFQFLSPPIAKDHDSGARVLWLRANAGVGKSVIAALAADELEKRNFLAGMFFAKHHDASRNTATTLIRTLAYQLCRWNADFGRLILEIIREKSNVSTLFHDRAPVDKMFVSLILEPLQKIAEKNPAQHPIVLVIDALDETGSSGFRTDILEVFSVHCQRLPTFVKVLVTSRPDEDIFHAFANLTIKKLQLTDEDNRRDAKLFANKILKDRTRTNDLENCSNLLVEKSGALFVWLEMARKTLAPLEFVTLKDIDDLREADTALSSLYKSTFDRIFGRLPDDHMIDVLSAIVTVNEPLRIDDYATLLDIPLATADSLIRKLSSVLQIDEDKVVRIFHKSVSDYLTDSVRCDDPRFAVHLPTAHSQLTTTCLRVLTKYLKYNIADLPKHMLHSDIPDFENRVANSIPPFLRYAAIYFWYHFSESENRQTNASGIFYFVSKKLLNWIEVLSLLNLTIIIPPVAEVLSELYQPHAGILDFTNELLADAIRLFQQFNAAISESALQIYVTAIPFSPREAIIYKHFIDTLPTNEVPRIFSGYKTDWPAYLRTLEGHAWEVDAVAVSSDGQFLVTGSRDQSLKIWAMNSGKEVRTLVGHTDAVKSVAISPDDRFIVSGSRDKTIRTWLMASGEQVSVFEGHSDSVYSVAISKDSRYVVSGSRDKTVKIWSMQTGFELQELAEHTSFVYSVAISSTSNFVVSGSWDETVKIWHLDGSERVTTLKGHTEGVNSVAISPNDMFVVSGSKDGNIKIWSVETGQELRNLSGHTSYVQAVTISSNGMYIVSGSWDRTVRIWSISGGAEVKKFEGHSRPVTSVAASSDWEHLVSGSMDETVKIWSPANSEEVMTPVGHKDVVLKVEISSDGRYINVSKMNTYHFNSGGICHRQYYRRRGCKSHRASYISFNKVPDHK
ncbi:hypothetical protein HK098_002809 [Nowakowskiella sp. JEL0407]|nr:hypothetical protein HK098_002809 [Nowakowskiella sp. JEL0407]